MGDEPMVFDKYAASKRSGFTVGFLVKNAQARKIPFTWLGRAYGWTQAQLEEIAAMQEERPASETRGQESGRRRRRES